MCPHHSLEKWLLVLTFFDELNNAIDFYRRASYIEPFDKVSVNNEAQLLKQLQTKSQVDNTADKLMH